MSFPVPAHDTDGGEGMPDISQLTTNDTEAYRTLRLEALKRCPEAFGRSHDEEAVRGTEFFADIVERNAVFGAFDDGILVGMAGFFVMDMAKSRHRGVLWGMYVQEAYRRTGIGETLVRAIMDHASDRVEQVHLGVVTTNEAARRFYLRCGFEEYGVDPRALKLGGEYYNEALMWKKFV